jgi:hypothetical protein
MQEDIKHIQMMLLINPYWISVTLEDFGSDKESNLLDFLEAQALREATMMVERRLATLN